MQGDGQRRRSGSFGWSCAWLTVLCLVQVFALATPSHATAPVSMLAARSVPGGALPMVRLQGAFVLVAGGAVAASSTDPDAVEGIAVRDPDPWEPFNRAIFWVNEKGDIYLVAPLARGWRFVTPSFFRKAVENVNGVMLLPVIGINDLLQLKPGNAWDDLMRLVFNASMGLGGLIDIATYLDIPKNDEDFGQTLGFWGVPTGPYLVLPVFGPSNVRDAIGRALDATGTLYFSWLPGWPVWGSVVLRAGDLVNLRARYLEEVEENRRESFDYYVFMRDAYMQNRAAKVERARGEEDAADEDLYYWDDETEEDMEEQRELDQDEAEPTSGARRDG